MVAGVVALQLLAVWSVRGLDNGVGVTPPLGYNTWNDFRCNVNASDILNVARTMKANGLLGKGFEYIVGVPPSVKLLIAPRSEPSHDR